MQNKRNEILLRLKITRVSQMFWQQFVTLKPDSALPNAFLGVVKEMNYTGTRINLLGLFSLSDNHRIYEYGSQSSRF